MARKRKVNPYRRQKNPAFTFDDRVFSEPSDFFTLLFNTIFENVPHRPSSPPMTNMEVFKDKWRKIMMLCHPDKHGNSELSQEVTRWLIENRPK